MGKALFKIIYLFLPLFAGANSPDLFARSNGHDKQRRSKMIRNEAKNEKDQNQTLDYDYELMLSLDGLHSAGSLSKSGDKTQSFFERGFDVDFQFGILLGDNFEPIVEVQNEYVVRKIGEYDESRNILAWGLGAVFNVPMSRQAGLEASEANAPLFANSDWIPYGGFIFTSTAATGSRGNDQKTNVIEDGIRTRLIFGSRYMIFSNVGLNFWVRVSYETTASEVTETNKTGGTLSKITVELNLLSFTVLI